MKLSRREFLRRLGWWTFTLSLMPLGLRGWAAGLEELAPTGTGRRKRLIVVLLRGAVDGLSIVVPRFEPAYYDARPTIALDRNASGGLLDLDGRFGLHPSLGGIHPLWKDGKLAFVHACGSPDPSRSHFDAQRFMECGTPGVITTADGWMNRLLGVLPMPHGPTQAIGITRTQPQILRGALTTTNFPLGRQAEKALPIDRTLVAGAFDALYDGDDALSRAYQAGQQARRQLMEDLRAENRRADNGAPSPAGFATDTAQLAKLLAQDSNIQLVFLDLGGWDTHINQGSEKGQLANRLKQLGDGLANLAGGLGEAYADTLILVMSEFGRTVRENGNGGTDHGHGNVIWLLGGDIQGGKIYGDWPGLDETKLYEGRDLDVTADFRSVIGTLLAQHFRLSVEQLAAVFPGFPESKLFLRDLKKLALNSHRVLTVG